MQKNKLNKRAKIEIVQEYYYWDYLNFSNPMEYTIRKYAPFNQDRQEQIKTLIEKNKDIIALNKAKQKSILNQDLIIL